MPARMCETAGERRRHQRAGGEECPDREAYATEALSRLSGYSHAALSHGDIRLSINSARAVSEGSDFLTRNLPSQTG